MRALFVITLLSFAAAPAGAQPPCAPDLAVVRPDPVSVEVVTRIEATASGAEALAVEWGDGAQSAEPVTRDGEVVALHQYRGAGATTLTAYAVCAGGTRSASVHLRVRVLPDCELRRGPSVTEPDCDDARGSLVLADDGGQTLARWVDKPCRDYHVIEQVHPPGDPPRARAASCLYDPGPPNTLYTRAGARIRLELGVPATRVVVRDARRRRIRVPRAVGTLGRVWRLRLPRALPARTSLHLVALRAGEVDEYAIRLRLER